MEVTQEDVQQMIISSFNGITNAQQFGVAKGQFHIHNGIDQPKIKYKDISGTPHAPYLGVVTSNVAGTLFPTGWSVTHGATGQYTITHNLGTTNYTVSVCPHSSTFFQLASKGTNSFLLIFWLNQANTSDNDFDFTVNT